MPNHLIYIFLIWCLDQATKLWTLYQLKPYQVVPVNDFFNWVLVFNPGAAFSFLSRAGGWQNIFFILLTLILLFFLIRWWFQSEDRLSSLSFVFIIGGALGNLTDRIRLGAVVDFLDFHWQHHHWPAFNLADAAISTGVILLLYREIKK